MQVTHLANFNSTNIGNGALIYGLEKVLKEDIPNIEFKRVAWDDYTFGFVKFDEKFINLVNATDGLIVGAAVTINGRHYLKETGMRFELPLRLWDKIKKPIIFYAISQRLWPYQRFYNLPAFKATMDKILRSENILFSVRNDGSKQWLENLLGGKSDKIYEIPDPAIYVSHRGSRHPELVKGRLNIILSLNNEDEVFRFGGQPRELFWRYGGQYLNENKMLNLWKKIPNWDSHKKKFLKELAGVIAKLHKETHLNVILVTHYLDDFKIISEFVPYLPFYFPHRRVVSCGMTHISQTEYFYDLYAQADLVLSMRIHSMAPAFGLGRPMIALSTQKRISNFMRQAGLEDYCVDIFDPLFAEKLYSRIKFCLANQSIVSQRFAASKAVMRKQSRDFDLKVFKLLTN